MSEHRFKDFNKQLDWSTKIYVLLVASTIAFSIYFDAWNNYWFPVVIATLSVVSLVDFLGMSITNYPGVWRKIGWALLLILIGLLLVGNV